MVLDAARRVARISDQRIGEFKHKLTELKTMIDTLEHLMRHCHGDHRPECPILDELAEK